MPIMVVWVVMAGKGFFVLGLQTPFIRFSIPSDKVDQANHSQPNNQPCSETDLKGLLFHEPWWLAAATNGNYAEAVVKSDNRVVARMPYVAVRRMGFTAIRLPPFTHLLGPVVDAGTGKPQTQLLRRLSLIRELLDLLPPFDSFKQAIESIADGLAFQDRGFHLSPQYTFEIDCRRDPAEIWDAMSYKTRQPIRRAEEKLSVTSIDDPNYFMRFYEENLKKRGHSSYMNFSTFPELFTQARARDSGEILCAHTSDGKPVAMVFLVWGHGVMYYLLSTRAYDIGDIGSTSLLIWSAINRAHRRNLVFDLDGVSTSGTARFLSSFGGHIKARVIVQRSRFLYNALSVPFRFGRSAETRAFT